MGKNETEKQNNIRIKSQLLPHVIYWNISNSKQGLNVVKLSKIKMEAIVDHFLKGELMHLSRFDFCHHSSLNKTKTKQKGLKSPESDMWD